MSVYNKREFVQKYVLKRARAMSESGFDALGAAETALETWEFIEKHCKLPKGETDASPV